MWDWFCFGIQLYIVVHFYIFGINLKCIRLGLGRLRGDEQTAVGSRNKNKREAAQYHHRRLITLEHSIINCVSRPPGLFTWDWEVFALGLTDWLCRPSAASSPQLRFVFCFFPPFIFFFSFHYEPRVRFIPHRLSITVRDSVCGIYLSKHQHLCDPQLWQTTGHWYHNGGVLQIVVKLRLTIAANEDDGPFTRSSLPGFTHLHVCEECASLLQIKT